VRRISGQVAAIERTIHEDAECSDVLHSIAVCRGAMDALMAEVIQGHIRYHVLPPGRKNGAQQRAADALVGALRTYLK
jgi:DNA-binding FrmR family transcriptional regulator